MKDLDFILVYLVGWLFWTVGFGLVFGPTGAGWLLFIWGAGSLIYFAWLNHGGFNWICRRLKETEDE